MDTIKKIMEAIDVALRFADASQDIVDRFNKGELTNEQAAEEWEKTRRTFREGADAWDAAGVTSE